MVPAAPLLAPTLTLRSEVAHSATPGAVGEVPGVDGAVVPPLPDDGVTVTVTVCCGEPAPDDEELPHPAASAAADPRAAAASSLRAAGAQRFMIRRPFQVTLPMGFDRWPAAPARRGGMLASAQRTGRSAAPASSSLTGSSLARSR